MAEKPSQPMKLTIKYSVIKKNAHYGCHNLTSVTIQPPKCKHECNHECKHGRKGRKGRKGRRQECRRKRKQERRHKRKQKRGCIYIENGAFGWCTGLENVAIKSNNDVIIGSKAFRSCTSLKSFVLPARTEAIGEEIFAWCSRLSFVVIPKTVTAIGARAFAQCLILELLKLPGSIEIGEGAFQCSGIVSIVLSEEVNVIKAFTFADCRKLEKLTTTTTKSNLGTKGAFIIPGSVTEIGKCAFINCTEMTSLILPDGLTIIGELAFFGCHNLKEVVIPDSVTKIGRNAFDPHTKLVRPS